MYGYLWFPFQLLTYQLLIWLYQITSYQVPIECLLIRSTSLIFISLSTWSDIVYSISQQFGFLSFPLPISSSRFISESYHLKVCTIPCHIFPALFFTISDWLTSALFRIYLIVVISLSVLPTCHHMYGYLRLSTSITSLSTPYLLISIPIPSGRLHILLYQISSHQIHFVFVLSLSLSAKFK